MRIAGESCPQCLLDLDRYNYLWSSWSSPPVFQIHKKQGGKTRIDGGDSMSSTDGASLRGQQRSWVFTLSMESLVFYPPPPLFPLSFRLICNVTPVTFLGTEFHENLGNFHCLADITAESGVLRSFEWYTTLCI